MSIQLYPSIAKIKRNGVYENLPGFVPETGSIATQQMIATSESSATAQYVHEKGEYFRLNDTLYQAIIKINVGDSIVVGTNCEVAVLGNDVTHIANSIAAYELGIATSDHVTGDYFMVGETLYVATDDISIGDNISTSTNCRLAVIGDELSGVQSSLTIIENSEPFTSNVWVQGNAWKATNGTMNLVDNTNPLRCKLVNDKLTPQISKIQANSGYEFFWFACTKNGNVYTCIAGATTWSIVADVKEYTKDYYLLMSCRKSGDANISYTEARQNILFTDELISKIITYDKLVPEIPEIERLTRGAVSTPSATQDAKLWYQITSSVVSAAGGTLKKFVIDPNKNYYATSKLLGASAGFPLITYFDSNDAFIGNEYPNTANVEISITNQMLNIPSNASWFYLNSRNFDSYVYETTDPSKTLPEVIEEIQDIRNYEISILFVGNSLTQDGIAYLPYLLKTYFPEIRFKIYMWYNGGYTLAQQYQDFVNDESCDSFSIAVNSGSWTNGSAKMSTLLTTYTFDIVCLQEYFNYKETYTTTDLADWNNCRDYIQSHYTGENGLEFISLFHAPLRSNAANVFALTETGNALILKDTISEDMIPIGMAVYDALSTDLDNLGDSGHLSPDGTHTQEGLPCLLQTYTALLWLLDKLSINKSIYGLPFKMTTAIYNTISVPGPNLGTGVIEGTDAQNLLAQEVAIKAYKEGKKFVADNIAT